MTHQWSVPPRPADGVEVNEVADGLVLYDESGAAVHYLNSSAAAIFALCDGVRFADAVVEEYRGLPHLEPSAPNSAWQCLDDLFDKGLVR